MPLDDKVYPIILDIQKQLGDIKSDSADRKGLLVSIDENLKATMKRVDALETDNSYRAGKMTIIGAIAGAIASLIIGIFINRLSK